MGLAAAARAAVPWKAGVMQLPEPARIPMGRREEQTPLQMGPSRTAHPSGSCSVANDVDVAFAPPCVASLNAREGWNAGSWDRGDRKMTAERCRKKRLLSKHFREENTRAVRASQLVSRVRRDQGCFSGQELYQLSKEKADFSVTAGEEDESTAGSSGENDGNSRSSTPHSSIKSPPSKSPAKAQKEEGKMMVLSGRSPLCLGQAGSGSLPSVRDLMVPPFTWISGLMVKAVQILGLALY